MAALLRMSTDFNFDGNILLDHQDIKTVSYTLKSIEVKKSHLLLPIESRIYYPLLAASNSIKIKPFLLLQLTSFQNPSFQLLPGVSAQLLLMTPMSNKQQIEKLLSHEFSNEIAFNKSSTFKCLLGFEYTLPSNDEHIVSNATFYFYLNVAAHFCQLHTYLDIDIHLYFYHISLERN
jgi:hypothetical protein